MLQLDDVRFGFKSRPDFLGPVSLTVCPGECWAIVGPNGAGKSTLLRLMAGLHKPGSGRISLNGVKLSRVGVRGRAKRVAFMPQATSQNHDFNARELVLMGRFPHRSLGLFESAGDVAIAERAMKQTKTLCFANRSVATLSGGESQRVHLAAALAQEPGLLLLDEPTASLDLQHQISIFSILKETASRGGRGGRAVVVVTHDVNLAANYCTHALLLHEGKVVASGAPADVLSPERLEPVYGVKLAEARVGDAEQRWVFPVSKRDADGEPS